MDDKALMENILLVTKGACDLYMHGTIESSTPDVRNCFNDSLFNALQMQDETYKKMSSYGWYQTTPVDKNKIRQARNKY